MKIRHNKKRNTAFVYEALIRENTVAILRGDAKTQKTIIEIVKKHFSVNTSLKKELECYRSLYENQDLDTETHQKILKECKRQRALIPTQELFAAQTALIHEVNKSLSPSIFKNFVPNYKTLATIAQIFSDTTTPKQRVILENQVIAEMREKRDPSQIAEQIDNVVYRTFVKKFNDKYEGELLDEQKELLAHYIASFSDNALGLKTFLNEEISRLKDIMAAARQSKYVKEDPDMVEKSKQVLTILDSYAQAGMNEKMLTTILKTQKLAKEMSTDGHNN
ncbi:MAG TPA: hypothetical protein EYN67_14675 [Flavobacteriales bacterium]|jgi:hypothetical protein|nr:hypothetical protein [Flavobacteriales bacterium]